MEETYDIIILGTGLVECVLSGLLSVTGYKVLHVDRNPYYGGASASLNLEQLYEKFSRADPPPENLGKSHLYCVDLIPKVLMCAGELVRILRATVVERYSMEFALIHSSFTMKDGKIEKVPSTPTEALSSSLMGFFQKRKLGSFLSYIDKFKEQDSCTWKYDLLHITANDLFKEFGLDSNTINFVGHIVALHTSDDYLKETALATVNRCKLYTDSMQQFGVSPYVYPQYGNGELPQAFSRLCAVFGGTFMLQTPVDKVHFDDKGKFTAIESDGKKAYGKIVIGDPSYFPDRVKPAGKVIRCIAIMDHPIPGIKADVESCQIIVPQREFNRNHDTYILQLGESNKVCPPGKYIAIIGTVVESEDPSKDIIPGLRVIGSTLEKFISVSTQYEPIEDGRNDNCFISKSYDATTHFEASARDILDLFVRVHGKSYDFELLEKAGKKGM